MILGLVIVIMAISVTPAFGATIGERFHEETRLTWFRSLKDVLTPKPAYPPSKEYKGQKINLPKPSFRGMTLEDTIQKRRSVRDYTKNPLALTDVSQLLFSAQGVTGETYGTPLRTAPSAGALYPIEVYIIANNVDGLKKGIYHYSVRDHSIFLIKEGDFGKKMMHAALEQEMMRDAGVIFVLSAIFDRVRSKYGERGYRYAYMEAGHIGQNIYLQATSLGLGSVVVGAFIDDGVNELIGVDGVREAAISLHAVGSMR